jgi:hypothetical protein
MIDEKTVWDDIWPVVERLIAATVAEDSQAIRQQLHPEGQASDALDLFGYPVFDIPDFSTTEIVYKESDL